MPFRFPGSASGIGAAGGDGARRELPEGRGVQDLPMPSLWPLKQVLLTPPVSQMKGWGSTQVRGCAAQEPRFESQLCDFGQLALFP